MARVAKATKPTKAAKSITAGGKSSRPTSAAAETATRGKKVTPAVKRSTTAEASTGRKVGPASKPAGAPRSAGKTAEVNKVFAQTPAAPAALKVSKDELRSKVEKLELTLATFRAKSRDSNRAAKVAAARIAELEEQVAQWENKTAHQAPVVDKPATAAKLPKAKRQTGGVKTSREAPSDRASQETGAPDDEAQSDLEAQSLEQA